MIRFLLISGLLLSQLATAQHTNQPRQFSSLLSHPKAGASLRLLVNNSTEKLLFKTEFGRISVLGSFDGSPELMRNKLIQFNDKFRVYTRIFTIEINPQNVLALLNIPEVSFVEATSRFNSPRPLDDKALQKSNVGMAQTLKTPSIKGNGVVMGIVDIGFQTTHPTFFNENGTKYRVKRFWQQKYTNQLGPSPYKYGILKNSEEEILAAVDADGSHGTHVAGIAAGSGFKSPDLKYAGVAPESDLVFVGIKYQSESLGGSALGDYLIANAAILDGFDYVFAYADSINKPAVCNLSWGMHTGPHDGTSLFDLGLEDMIRYTYPINKNPGGRALVGANGNSARHEMHVKLVVDNDSAATLAMDRSRTSFKTENVYCDFWAEQNSQLQFQIVLIDSVGNALLSTPFYKFEKDTLMDFVLSNLGDTLSVMVSSTETYPHNQKANALMMIEANSNKRFIKINFKGKGEVHGWNSGRTYEWTAGTFRNYIKSYKPSHWVNGDANNTLIENGGTSKAILSVGSYNNRVNWLNYESKFQSDSAIDEGEISSFSSWGPTLDGRLNPDVSAPGQFIANAYHKDAVPGWLKPYIVHKDEWNGDDVYWVLLSGTSMASPHAAGVVALMLQASEGKLRSSDIQEIIRATSLRDGYTGAESNFQYGAGKINAYGAVLASINALRTSQPKLSQVIIFASEKSLKVKGLAMDSEGLQYQIMETTGRVVIEGISRSGEMPFDGINTGVYFVRILHKGTTYGQSIFIKAY